MTDIVKATSNVTLKYTLHRTTFHQRVEATYDCIGRRSLRSESIGVGICTRFGNRLKCQVHSQHRHQRIRQPVTFSVRVMRLDQGNQALPWHHLIHLDQEQLFAGLITLPCVLGIGEGHLFYWKTRREVRAFCQNEEVFFRISVRDRDAADDTVAYSKEKYPSLNTLFVDSACAGKWAQRMRQTRVVDVQVIRGQNNGRVGQWRSEQGDLFTVVPAPTGFVVVPRRWVVERTHARNERVIDHAPRSVAHRERGVGVAGRGTHARASTRCMILSASS